MLDLAEECGVDVCYEIHPGEDIHDGATWERFLDEVKGHSRANILYDPSHFVLQCLDYLQFIDLYHDRIKMFHVKDAAIFLGESVQVDFVLWVMVRLIGRLFLQNWRVMTFLGGLCWNGNVRIRIT